MDGGLVLKPSDGGGNFMIAGKDGKFELANVRIMGRDLIVSSPNIKDPVYVRYGWDEAPAGSLFNKAVFRLLHSVLII